MGSELFTPHPLMYFFPPLVYFDCWTCEQQSSTSVLFLVCFHCPVFFPSCQSLSLGHEGGFAGVLGSGASSLGAREGGGGELPP